MAPNCRIISARLEERHAALHYIQALLLLAKDYVKSLKVEFAKLIREERPDPMYQIILFI